MTSYWLEMYLAEAVGKKLCTKIHGTTCGAMEFRRGVLNTLSIATGLPGGRQFARDSAVEVARTLFEVTPHSDAPGALKDAVECLFCRFVEPLLNRDIGMPRAGTISAQERA
jgi:hypothetical protein